MKRLFQSNYLEVTTREIVWYELNVVCVLNLRFLNKHQNAKQLMFVLFSVEIFSQFTLK